MLGVSLVCPALYLIIVSCWMLSRNIDGRFFKEGKLERVGSSITEGIGQGRITDNMKDAPIDDALRVTDEETSASPLIHNVETVRY